jgi:hypothetical protein
MQRETIEMSYFARCGFCSEIIVAERLPIGGLKLSGQTERLNDNRFRIMAQSKPAQRRVRRVMPAA